MSSLRAAFQPLVRQAPRLALRRTPLVARRFLNTETAPVLYSAHAKVVGARTGHVDGDDLKVDLTMVCLCLLPLSLFFFFSRSRMNFGVSNL